MNNQVTSEQDTEPKRISFSAYYHDKLESAIKERAPADGYSMHLMGDDYNHAAKAINQGIDSHLEAIQFEQSSGIYGKRGLRITADTLHVLVRRLMETADETGEAHSLASCICETLNIELV